uniref:ABCF1 n=1 Tax=Arundo donax TaxID=35708 RepID=A0A0A9DDN0_ARUDO
MQHTESAPIFLSLECTLSSYPCTS